MSVKFAVISYIGLNVICLIGCITFYILSIKVCRMGVKTYKDMSEMLDNFVKTLDKKDKKE